MKNKISCERAELATSTRLDSQDAVVLVIVAILLLNHIGRGRISVDFPCVEQLSFGLSQGYETDGRDNGEESDRSDHVECC